MNCFIHIIFVYCYNRSEGQYKYLSFTDDEIGDWSFNNLCDVIELTRKLRFEDETLGSKEGLLPLSVWVFNVCHSFTKKNKDPRNLKMSPHFILMRKISSNKTNRVAQDL